MVWRVVMSKMATLQEIERHWSLTDLLDAHEALDYKKKIDEWSSPKRKG